MIEGKYQDQIENQNCKDENLNNSCFPIQRRLWFFDVRHDIEWLLRLLHCRIGTPKKESNSVMKVSQDPKLNSYRFP